MVGLGSQLSVAVTLNHACASPKQVQTFTLGGQWRTGGTLSCTVTVKLHVLTLPQSSLAAQFTGVTPQFAREKRPEGTQVMRGVGSKLSTAVAVGRMVQA